jgi:transcriptional regulator with XRE-family HTH domain
MNETIGATVRDLRQRLGIQQGDLAKQIGMSKAMLCQVETGKRGLAERWIERFPAGLLLDAVASAMIDEHLAAIERLRRIRRGNGAQADSHGADC